MGINYKKTKFIVAEWSPSSTQWDLNRIFEVYNKRNGFSYTKENIKDHWINWGVLYIELEDGKIIEHEGLDNTDIDYKAPTVELYYDEKFEELSREKK